MMTKLLKFFSAYDIFERFVNNRLRKNGLVQREIELENSYLEYWDSESLKPPLLLLPAFAPESKYSWFKQISVLSKHYRIVLPNFIYFGKSKSKKNSFHISDQVDAIHQLLKKLDIHDLTIAATCYGGIVATELALRPQLKIQKIVLSSTPFKFFEHTDSPMELLKLDIQKKSDLIAPGNSEKLKQLFNYTYHRKLPIPFFVFKNLYRHLYSNQIEEKKKLVDTFIEDGKVIHQKSFPFKCPVLLISGEFDKLVHLEIAQEMRKRVGEQAQLIVIPKTAHMPNFEKPRLFNKIILSFLLETK